METARTLARFGAIALAALVGVAGAARTVLAQGFPGGPAPVYSAVDGNGVDLVTGAFNISSTDVTVGPPGGAGLAFTRFHINSLLPGWTYNQIATVSAAGTSALVSIGDKSENFTESNGVYANAQGGGSTLAYDGVSLYTYTTAAGVVWQFSNALAGLAPPAWGSAMATSATYPNGLVVTFSYQTISVCFQSCPGTMVSASRLMSVGDNAGWQLKLAYAVNTAATTGDLVAWTTLASVAGVNNATSYCSPTSNATCIVSGMPNATYAIQSGTPATSTKTDTLGRVTTYTYSSTGQITGIERPSGATTTVTYNSAGQVASVSNGTGTWLYAYTTSGAVPITTVTDPLGHTVVATGALNSTGQPTGQLATYTDGLDRETQYAYDADGRLTQIERPAGDEIQYTYDQGTNTRGNVTQTTHVPVTGSGLGSISTHATFDAACAHPAKCNKPNTTTDADGNVTDYGYDNTHGVLLSVTGPAPTTGAVQPQSRLSYTLLYAWYKNSAGTIVKAATPIDLPTGTSACQTEAASACVGTSDEVKGVLAYGTQGVANTLELTSSSTGAGDGSLTATTAFTYDAVGNRLKTTPPLGAAWASLDIYDTQRELTGVIGPDPDGAAGPLHFPAVRYTYNPDGRVTLQEQGTTTAQTAAAFANFSTLQQQATAYDTVGRRAQTSFASGGTTYNLTQYAYDNANNLTCLAVRVDPAQFSSEPASACVQGPYSAIGPDQITYRAYDAANELTSVTIGYGTPAQAHYATLTYSANGLPVTVLDANNNLTTTVLDGLGRVSKTEFPMPTLGAKASNPSDYEGFTYDANGNVLTDRRRSGETISFTYDALGRPTIKTFPAGTEQNVYQGYDLLNRLLYANFGSAAGTGIANAWDALGRQTSATATDTTPARTLSYQYDLDGNRTRVTWPDAAPNALYVQYVRDYLGRITSVEENGATSGVGLLATYQYDNLGRITEVTRAGGASAATTTAAYDGAGRLSAFTQAFASSANDAAWGFGYDGADQLMTRSATNDAYSFHAPAGTASAYVANGLNQYAKVAGTSYTHDARGNLTSDGTASFSYDLENHLLTASAPTAVSLTYDPLGRLQTSTASGATTTFLYDGNDLVGEYDSSGDILDRFVFGPGVDDPVVWYQGAGTTSREWLQSDNQNSVVAWSDSSGALVGSQAFGPYGEPSTWTGAPFGYTGQITIPQAELYFYKSRMYDPAIGRFLQTDPIGYASDVNAYAYAGNDPVNFLDPLGTQDVCSGDCQPETPSLANGEAQDVAGNGDTVTAGGNGFTVIGQPVPDLLDQVIQMVNLQNAGNILQLAALQAGIGGGLQGFSLNVPGSPQNASACNGPRVLASYGGSATAAFLLGLNLSASVNVAVPATINWSNPLQGLQVGMTVQGAIMVGEGGFVGAGEQISEGLQNGPLETGFSGPSLYGEADAGAGPAVGISGQYTSTPAGRVTAVSGGLNGKYGIGAGLYAGAGLAGGGTLAASPLGCP